MPMRIDAKTSCEEPLSVRLKAGQEEAADELVGIYADRLLRAATLILGDVGLAEDAVQETLLSVVTCIDQFRSESALYSWMYTILIRHCRHYQRHRRKTQSTSSLMPPEDFSLIPDPGPPIEDAWERSQKGSRVSRAVESLPPRYREVIVMFYYEEFSIPEISDITGKPVGTIKSLLHRGRRKLATTLGGEEL
jgi:RNA polymerase sigma-70 factor (ECF subfamily)